MEITTNTAKYRIILLNDDIIRIRCTFNKEFEKESSYALVMTAWEDVTDDLLAKERMKVKALSSEYDDSEYTDPLYKHIPFYIKFNSENNTASGIFYNNSHDSILM